MRSVGIIPALALVVGAAAGTAGGTDAAVSSAFPSWLPLALLLLSLLAWWLRHARLTVVLVTSGFLAAAIVSGGRARDHALHPALRSALDARFGGFAIETLGPEGDHQPQRLRARLIEDAADQGDYVSLRTEAVAIHIDGTWSPVDGGTLLTVSGAVRRPLVEQWRAGRLVEMPVVFRRPARYLDKGVRDFEEELALAGTTLFGSIKSGLQIDVLQHGSWAAEKAADVRAHVRGATTRWIAAGRGATGTVTGAVVTAVLIGDRTGLPDQVRDRLQAAGTYHVIAISGGNIAILAMLTIGLLAVAGIQGRIAAMLSIALLICYAGIVTSGPSVWRATIVAVVYLAARLIDHRTPVWQATAVAAALVVTAHPLDVRNVGFLLTFGATAALIEGARWGRAVPARRLLAWLVASLAASIAVEATLLPVAAESFSRVTSAGVVLNLLAVPVMAVVQVAGTIVVLLDGVGFIAGPAGWVAHSGAWLLIESARLVEIAPWLTWRMPPPGMFIIGIYYVGLAALVFARSRARIAGGATVAATLLIIVGGIAPAASASAVKPGALRLTVFDVGQGDAMLLQPPGAAALMIDSGGAPFGSGGFDIGGRVLSPAIWSLGLRTLGGLLITHGDPDHIGGAASILDDFSPGELWLGVTVPAHLPEDELLKRAARDGVRVLPRRSGERINAGGATIRVLHPPEPDWERRRVRNDDSVVLEVVYRDVALLLTGDIGSEIERQILPQLTPARVRILKVGHHGSRTSSARDFLEGWRPTIAIISCGRGNSFGHPTPEVVQRLESVGATVYRTDRDGEVTLETDGHRVDVRTFVGGSR